jgi:hypothetical protein
MQLNPSWKLPVTQLLKNFPDTFWNPKIHFLFHKSLPFVPILSQMNPIRINPLDSNKFHINIILLTNYLAE